MESIADVDILLKVDVNCEACKMKTMEILNSISGIYSITIDAQERTTKVSGKVNPNILLRAFARSGRHAELVWVKLKHPVLNHCNYENDSYGHYGSYNSYGGSYGYGAIDEPYPYSRTWPERSYYNTHEQYPRRMVTMDGPTTSTMHRYDRWPLPPARYVPGYPPPAYDSYDDEPISFCSIM